MDQSEKLYLLAIKRYWLYNSLNEFYLHSMKSALHYADWKKQKHDCGESHSGKWQFITCTSFILLNNVC